MPVNPETWASWNYITASTATPRNADKVSLTYNMNILQHIHPSRFGNVLVTLNPLIPPDPSTVQGEWEYEHPLYTSKVIQAQRRLGEIQNKRGITFAGAWTGYGFHEDGFTSGLRAAVDSLGAEVPWDVKCVRRDSPRKKEVQEIGLRMVIGFMQWCIMVLEVLLTSRGTGTGAGKVKQL